MNRRLSELLEGCQSHGCAVPPKGQATKGRCRCVTTANFLWLLNEAVEMNNLLEDALPSIQCETKEQSDLITAIGGKIVPL